MRCEHCDYLLFNLLQPVCPECGRSFSIEQYRFDPGVVSFNCPHCDQEYYGNDEQGLPFPRQFECVKCRGPLTLQDLRVVPKREDAQGRPAVGSPWDYRQRLGTRKAWWDTFVMTLIRPGRLFRTHQGTSNWEAWRFATISNYIGMLPYFLFLGALMWGIGAIATRTGGGPGGASPFGYLAAFYVLMGLFGPLVFPATGAAISAACIQLALLVLARDRKTIGYSYRVALYAQGPYALVLVPICGAYAASIWALVTMIIGIKEVHKISGWRASIAVLWPVVLLIGLYIVVLVLIFV